MTVTQLALTAWGQRPDRTSMEGMILNGEYRLYVQPMYNLCTYAEYVVSRPDIMHFVRFAGI